MSTSSPMLKSVDIERGGGPGKDSKFNTQSTKYENKNSSTLIKTYHLQLLNSYTDEILDLKCNYKDEWMTIQFILCILDLSPLKIIEKHLHW